MKANELRIGNYVYETNNLLADVSNWHFEKASLDNTPNEINVNPIQLTEEWLLKFGFENIDGYKELYNPKDEFCEQFLYTLNSGISYREFNCYPFKGWYVKLGDYDDKLKIKHVHQLQNLYFALTGEELTTKELIHGN